MLDSSKDLLRLLLLEVPLRLPLLPPLLLLPPPSAGLLPPALDCLSAPPPDDSLLALLCTVVKSFDFLKDRLRRSFNISVAPPPPPSLGRRAPLSPPLPFSLFSRPRSLGWPVPPSSSLLLSGRLEQEREGEFGATVVAPPREGGRGRPTQSPLPREWAGKSGGAYADGALGGRSRAQPLFSQIGFGVNAGSIFFSG